MDRWVEISFDCLPLRTVTRLDIPLDASPKYRAFCERVKAAIEKHGSHNTYYLHRARCTFHLTNDPQRGLVEFTFEGTALTDPQDTACQACDLQIELAGETCEWLTTAAVEWLKDTVLRAVAVEFDRYIAAGDLDRAKERIRQLEATVDESGGFIGMYL